LENISIDTLTVKNTIATYNPFEPLTLLLLNVLLMEGNQFIVLQRFPWPGIPSGRAFMASAYLDEQEAVEHVGELEEKEGKMLNLITDFKKITSLIENGEHQLFINTIKEKDWAGKVLKAYKGNIAGYVRSRTRIKASDGVDIELKLKWGRLFAHLSSGEVQIDIPAYELIK
jgi:hypothetical protein